MNAHPAMCFFSSGGFFGWLVVFGFVLIGKLSRQSDLTGSGHCAPNGTLIVWVILWCNTHFNVTTTLNKKVNKKVQDVRHLLQKCMLTFNCRYGS